MDNLSDHPDWNTRTLAKINENTEKILEFHKNKADNVLLTVKLGEITTKLEILTKQFKDLSAQLDNASRFLFLIAEYSALAKDGTIDEYRGHLRHINNLAETAKLNLAIFKGENEQSTKAE